MISARVGKGWHVKIIEDISVESKFFNFGLGDMNSYTHDAVLCAPLAPIKEGQPA